MNDFRYYNPTTIIFGKGTIAKLDELIKKKQKIMLLYGGGSIKKNGVYDQVIKALGKRKVIEFGGIEPNPDYETLMKAVSIVQKKDVDLMLAVGGGSVIDGVKFISLAAKYDGNPWHILTKGAAQDCTKAVPFGLYSHYPQPVRNSTKTVLFLDAKSRLNSPLQVTLFFHNSQSLTLKQLIPCP